MLQTPHLPAPESMVGNDANAAFQEALSLLDEFYAVDGIDLLPDATSWPTAAASATAKHEPTVYPPTLAPPPPVAGATGYHHATGATALPGAPLYDAQVPCPPNSTASEDAEDQDNDAASQDGRSAPGSVAGSAAGSSGAAPRRNRQREELLRLRDEAKQLDERLNDLKLRRKSAAAVASAMSQDERDMMALWEKIAVRQQSERQRVEIENAKLKDLFSAQTRVAQELRRLLEKQMKAHTTVPSLCEDGQKVAKRRCRLEELPDYPVFHELLSGLEQSYREVDAVFQATGIDAVAPPFRTTQLKLDDHVGVRVEMLGRRIVPFDAHDMSHAIWTHAQDGALHPSYYFYDEADAADNTIARYCGIRAPHGNASVDLHGKHVSRRFIEADRVVITWRAVLEPQVYSGVPATDLRFRESGWVVLTRAGAPGACEVRMFRVISPDVPVGGEPTADWRIYALIDFVSTVVHTHGSVMQQKVENYLLENALKRQMSNAGSHEGSSTHRTPSITQHQPS